MEKLNNMNTTETELKGYKPGGAPGMMHRGGGMKKRARGGAMESKAEEAMEEGKKKHHRRKHGGMVPGMMAKHRPDKRARGGGVTSDENPLTSAGKMSKMPYENKEAKNSGDSGAGADKE